MGFKKVFHAVTITVIALLATAASAQARAAVNNPLAMFPPEPVALQCRL